MYILRQNRFMWFFFAWISREFIFEWNLHTKNTREIHMKFAWTFSREFYFYCSSTVQLFTWISSTVFICVTAVSSFYFEIKPFILQWLISMTKYRSSWCVFKSAIKPFWIKGLITKKIIVGFFYTYHVNLSLKRATSVSSLPDYYFILERIMGNWFLSLRKIIMQWVKTVSLSMLFKPIVVIR